MDHAALFDPGDAALDVASQILAGGKNSRLFKRLVYDLQIAQDVSAFQSSAQLSSQFLIVATARPAEGKPPAERITEIQTIIDEEVEKLRQTPPEPREFERAMNWIEASFYNRMESVGGFGGKADQLNSYWASTRDPDYFNEDLARYKALSPSDIQAAIRAFLPPDRRIELIVEPQGPQKPSGF